MSDIPTAGATSAPAPVHDRWVRAFALALGSAFYGWCANLVFHRLLHWVSDDISRTAFWSILLFTWVGAAILMSQKARDPGTTTAEEHEQLLRAATRRAATAAVIGETIILTIWSYGRHRQWI